MLTIKLSVLSMLLGLGVALPSLYGVLKPTAFAVSLRKFPRSLTWGYALITLGTAWFLYYLAQESVSDFAAYKPLMYFGFALLGVLTCIYLPDFLAVRGLAVVMLLLAKLMLDTARWAETPWRLVIVIWAYAMIIAGMWFTVSPWRCRDLLNWSTANEKRLRVSSGIKLAFCLFVIFLGLAVFQ
jgi:hypothetical protein